jgi:hypothetical protein
MSPAARRYRPNVTQTPDFINHIAGVRIWRVAPNLWAQLGGLLWAPNVKEPWPTGEEYVATCPATPDHAPPQEGCSCGIYAFYDAQLAQQGGYWPQEGAPHFRRLVAGVVGAAGDVVLHERGLLAARATVEAIFTAGAHDEELPIPRAELAAAYGAEVIDAADYEAFCAGLGLIAFSAED